MAICARPMKRPCSTTPGNAGKRMRQRVRIGDAAERGIEDPVPAIRDESMAVAASPQA